MTALFRGDHLDARGAYHRAGHHGLATEDGCVIAASTPRSAPSTAFTPRFPDARISEAPFSLAARSPARLAFAGLASTPIPSADGCQPLEHDTAPACSFGDRPFELAPDGPMPAAFHDATRASATCARTGQEVLAPATDVVQTASGAPVAQARRPAHECTKLQAKAEIASAAPLVKGARLATTRDAFPRSPSQPTSPPRGDENATNGPDLEALPPRPGARCRLARCGRPLRASPRSHVPYGAMLHWATASSIDFCHTRRNTDAPRDSLGPRALDRLRPRPTATFLAGRRGRERATWAPPSHEEDVEHASIGCGESRTRSTLVGWTVGSPGSMQPGRHRVTTTGAVAVERLTLASRPEARPFVDPPAKGSQR